MSDEAPIRTDDLEATLRELGIIRAGKFFIWTLDEGRLLEIAACINRAPLLERAKGVIERSRLYLEQPDVYGDCKQWLADYDAATKGGV